MKNFRERKDVTIHAHSFGEFAETFGLKKKTMSAAKLKVKQEDFCKSNKCHVCGQPMTYVCGNVMICKNPECKGVKKIVREGSEKKEVYEQPFRLLTKSGERAAERLFG